MGPPGKMLDKEDVLQAVVIADSFDSKFQPLAELTPRVKRSPSSDIKIMILH